MVTPAATGAAAGRCRDPIERVPHGAALPEVTAASDAAASEAASDAEGFFRASTSPDQAPAGQRGAEVHAVARARQGHVQQALGFFVLACFGVPSRFR